MLVLQVGRVDEDELVVTGGDVDLFLEDGDLVAGVLVEADLANAQDAGVVQEGGDQLDDVAGEGDVFGLLGVDAEPGVVVDSVSGGSFRLDVG